MIAFLRQQCHGQPHALLTIRFEHAPTGDVAKAFRLTADLAKAIKGTDATYDFAFLAHHEAKVSSFWKPLSSQPSLPVRCGAVCLQV